MRVAHAFYGPKDRGVFLLVRFLCTSKENGLARGCDDPQPFCFTPVSAGTDAFDFDFDFH